MTGLGGGVCAMQQGCPGQGQRGLGDTGGQCHSLWRLCLETPGAQPRPSEAPEGPRPGPEAGVSQPSRCRQHGQGGGHVFLLGPGAHPVVQK